MLDESGSLGQHKTITLWLLQMDFFLSYFIIFQKLFLYFMCVSVLSAPHMCVVPLQARRRNQISWSRIYSQRQPPHWSWDTNPRPPQEQQMSHLSSLFLCVSVFLSLSLKDKLKHNGITERRKGYLLISWRRSKQRNVLYPLQQVYHCLRSINVRKSHLCAKFSKHFLSCIGNAVFLPRYISAHLTFIT